MQAERAQRGEKGVSEFRNDLRHPAEEGIRSPSSCLENCAATINAGRAS